MEGVYRQTNRSRAPPKSFDLLGIGIIAWRLNHVSFAPIYVLFPNEFSKQITRCFFHYAPAEFDENAKNSDNLLVKDVANLFARTSGAIGSSFIDFTNSNQKAASFRTKVLKSAKREGSKLINLTLVKIGLIQEEKFQLEKEMIDGLMKRGAPKEDVLEIVNTHSFGKKLNAAKKKAKNKPVQLEFLKHVEKVFQENRIMFNYFDHALSNMLPPYLATSILDIQQFKTMVDSLKDKDNQQLEKAKS